MEGMERIKCQDCGANVYNLAAHRFLTKKQGKPCLARPVVQSLEDLQSAVDQAIEFTLPSNYGSKCLKAFEWWLAEDATDEDFEGFKFTYDTVQSITDELLERIPNYKCNVDCEWCN